MTTRNNEEKTIIETMEDVKESVNNINESMDRMKENNPENYEDILALIEEELGL